MAIAIISGMEGDIFDNMRLRMCRHLPNKADLGICISVHYRGMLHTINIDVLRISLLFTWFVCICIVTNFENPCSRRYTIIAFHSILRNFGYCKHIYTSMKSKRRKVGRVIKPYWLYSCNELCSSVVQFVLYIPCSWSVSSSFLVIHPTDI